MSTPLGYEHVGHQLNISVALGNNYVIQQVFYVHKKVLHSTSLQLVKFYLCREFKSICVYLCH